RGGGGPLLGGVALGGLLPPPDELHGGAAHVGRFLAGPAGAGEADRREVPAGDAERAARAGAAGGGGGGDEPRGRARPAGARRASPLGDAAEPAPRPLRAGRGPDDAHRPRAPGRDLAARP